MKKIIKYFLIPLFIFIIFFTFYNNVYKKISILYWDEDGWLGRGYFFELLIKGDFNNPLWDTPLAFDQPKLTEYMYGAAIYPTYLKYKEKLSKKNIDYAQFFIDHNFYQVDGEKYEKYKENNYQFIDWEKGKFVDFDASASQLVNKYGQNFQKTIDLIFTARKINVYLLSLNVVIVYYISVFCFGLFPSLLISLLFGSNNFIIEACLKAHSEGLFLFLFNLDLLILILTVKKNRLFSILFAIVTGLLWQTKINGVMMLIIFNTVFLTKMAINWFKSNKKIVGYLQVKRAIKIITPTYAVKKQLTDIYGSEISKKLYPIYEGVSYEIFTAKESKSFGIKFKDFFIYVGNFYPHKNVERLIDAFAKISDKYHLILIGPNDYFTDRIIKYIETSKSKNKIILIKNPPMSDLIFFYKNALAIIHPSLSEGFGLPLVEAAYFDTPIMASNIEIFKELWGDQYLSFDARDSSDIYKKIQYFIDKKPRFEYNKIIKKYSFEKRTWNRNKIKRRQLDKN